MLIAFVPEITDWVYSIPKGWLNLLGLLIERKFTRSFPEGKVSISSAYAP